MKNYPSSHQMLTAATLALLIAGWSTMAISQSTTATDVSTASLAAANNQLTAVRTAIHDKAADWKAQLNSVALLPLTTKKRMTGVPEGSRNLPSFTNPAYHRAQAAALPGQFNWRNVNGRNYVSAVKNQGQCGSCWAFAVTAALESKAMISNEQPNTNLNLSEQVVLSCSQAGSCNGGWPDQATKFLVKTGDPSESYFPYTGGSNACSQSAPGWQQASYRLQSWQYVVTNALASVDLLKNALYTTGPLVTTMRVYEDFFYYASGIYHHVNGNYIGNHAVVIIGWDDNAQAFIVKNSWGADWGEEGFFRISYQELSGDTQFASQMTLSNGPAIIPPSPACQYALSSNTVSIPAGGQSGSILINTQASCGWKAQSSATWLSITSSTTGSGNGEVSYTIAANPDKVTRTATLNIGNQTVMVTQASTAPVLPAAPKSLLSPDNNNNVQNPAFVWQPVANADTYYLYIGTSSGEKIFQGNYSAAGLGCATGANACKVTPKLSLTSNSAYRWFVLAANSAGYSSWSTAKPFHVSSGAF